MSRGSGRIIGQRIRIRPCDDESASSSASSRLDLPSVSSACTPRPQYLQSATPPHLPIHTADLPIRSYRTVARCCRSGMTLGEFGSQCVLVRVAVTKPPNVMDGLRLACGDPALRGIDPEQITYYFRRVMVVANGNVPGMAVWRE